LQKGRENVLEPILIKSFLKKPSVKTHNNKTKKIEIPSSLTKLGTFVILPQEARGQTQNWKTKIVRLFYNQKLLLE